MALFQPARGGAGGTGAPPPATPVQPVQTAGPARGRASGYEAVRASRDFWTIRRRLGSFIVPACVFLLGWYFLFVILAVFAPGFMRVSVFGDVNVGLCLGLLQFASTFAIALGYRRWARRRLDPLTDRLRQRLEGGRY
jgi:uncharacterized membrane protein (DUF485 family)